MLFNYCLYIRMKAYFHKFVMFFSFILKLYVGCRWTKNDPPPDMSNPSLFNVLSRFIKFYTRGRVWGKRARKACKHFVNSNVDFNHLVYAL